MRAVLLVLALGYAVSLHSAIAATSSDAEQLAARIETRLKEARYMEQHCQPVAYPGWEGFETQRCNYTITDAKTGTQKPGLVVMLNPTALMLSNWIVEACKRVRPNLALSTCSDYLVNRVIKQSGGQFAVAGVVYEDIIPEDNVYEAYAFRDGVTVVLEGVKHRGTKLLTPPQLEAALTTRPSSTVTKAGYARIAGTSSNEYRWANPGTDIEGLKWPTAVRMSYQQAWLGDRNYLIEQWLLNNPPETAPQ